jgi:VWFA-related protein
MGQPANPAGGAQRVNLLCTVTDKRGRFVNNLTKDNFEVSENRRPQQILEVTSQTGTPLRIGLLIETSNSARDGFQTALESAAEFLRGVIRKDSDKALIYSVDTQPELVQDLTGDANLLTRRLLGLRAGGSTSLWDAMYAAARASLVAEQPRAAFRHAIVIVGDSQDTSSSHTRDQALEMVLRNEVAIYGISTNGSGIESDGDRMLKQICQETGGRACFPSKIENLVQEFENLANELRSQYVISYTPDPPATDGAFRRVEVRVSNRRDTVVRARRGYYPPAL